MPRPERSRPGPAADPPLPELRRPLRSALRVSPALRRGLGVTAALALVAGAARVIAPLTVQHALDSGFAPTTVVVSVAVGAAATLAAGLSSWRLNLRIRLRVEEAIAGLRRDGLVRVHDMAPSTADRVPSADLVARLGDDLDAMSTFLQGGGIQFVTNLAQLAIATVVLAVYSPALALPLFVVAGALLLGMRRMQQVIRGRFVRVRRDLAALQGTIGESVAGATVIRATGTAERTRAKLDEAVDRARDAQLRTLAPLNVNTGFGEIGITAMTLTIVLGGVWWATRSPEPVLTTGELVAMIFLVTIFVRPLQFLVQSLGEAQNALSGWRRAVELVMVPSGAVRGGRILPAGPVGIGFRGVTAGYGDGPDVLHDVDVEVAPGEHVAVVGRTGSGKSTFAKLLTRRVVPRRGGIVLSGLPLGDLDDATLAGRVVLLPQDPFLFNLSVADNVAVGAPEGAGATRADVVRTMHDLGLGDWVAGLPDGLDTPVGPRGERLSVGERQLVALARTALADPDLVVFDEATSGVDPATDVAVQRALRRLTHGRTTVSIAHRLSTAVAADRVLVFAEGRLAQQGAHAALAAQPGPYAELFAAWRRHSGPDRTEHRGGADLRRQAAPGRLAP